MISGQPRAAGNSNLAYQTHQSRDNVDSNKLYFQETLWDRHEQTDLVVDSQGNVIFAEWGSLFC